MDSTSGVGGTLQTSSSTTQEKSSGTDTLNTNTDLSTSGGDTVCSNQDPDCQINTQNPHVNSIPGHLPVGLVSEQTSTPNCIQVSHTCPTNIFFPWTNQTEVNANTTGFASCINANVVPCTVSMCGTPQYTCVTGVPDVASQQIVGSEYRWNCNDSGTIEACTYPLTLTPQAGVCSSTIHQCSSGAVGTTVDTATHYEWSCMGINGSSINEFCSVPIPRCGSSNGGDYASVPTSNLCVNLPGITASAVSGSGPWTWSCSGNSGSTPASCSAGALTSYTWVRQGDECRPDDTALDAWPPDASDPQGEICFAPGALVIWENGAGSGCWYHYICGGSSIITGSCGVTNNDCIAGNYSDLPDTMTHYEWRCTGTTSASSVTCSIPKPAAAGVCGSTNNTCDLGQVDDIPDDTENYLWNCQGLNGGNVTACSLSMGNIHVACGSAHEGPKPADLANLCAAGNPDNYVAGGAANGEDIWNCMGIGTMVLNTVCHTGAAATSGGDTASFSWNLEFDIPCIEESSSRCYAVKIYQCLNGTTPANVDGAPGCNSEIGVPDAGAGYNAVLNSGSFTECSGGGMTCAYFRKPLNCSALGGVQCLTHADSGSSGGSGGGGSLANGTLCNTSGSYINGVASCNSCMNPPTYSSGEFFCQGNNSISYTKCGTSGATCLNDGNVICPTTCINY